MMRDLGPAWAARMCDTYGLVVLQQDTRIRATVVVATAQVNGVRYNPQVDWNLIAVSGKA